MSDKPKITLQEFGFQDSNYERPNQRWVCGRLSEGCPCHIGPNNKGECLATFECQPNRKGDRWDCTRPASRGGKCEQGPNPDGTCCKSIPKCQPHRSIRAKRGVFVGWCVAITVGALAIILFSESRMKFIQPGELSHVHGQVFKNPNTGQACAMCHTAAHSDDEKLAVSGSSPKDWAHAAFNGANSVSENQKCLQCHQRHPGLAEFPHDPHGIDPKLMATVDVKEPESGAPLRWMFAGLGPDVPKTSEGQLACALTCHKEHRGEMHDLTALNNHQCQACHTQKFESFSKGHPEFKQFPYDRRTRLIFDHARHRDMHFKSSNSTFNCAQCHRVDATSEHMNVRSFEQACSQCHGDSMRKFDEGVAVIRLPGMDLPTLTEFTETAADNPWLGQWPPKADYGLNPPAFTPFMKMLLSADDDVAEAFASLPDKFDFGDLTQATDDQKKAAIRIGWGVKELVYELSRNGQEALRVRLAKVLGEEINNDRLAELTGQVPASLLTAAQQQWFPDLLVNVELYRNGKPLPGRPAVKPPKPDPPKPDKKDPLDDDDLFGPDPTEPDDDLFSDDPPDKPVDDSLFEEDAPKKPVSDDLFAPDDSEDTKKEDDGGLFELDDEKKEDSKDDGGLFELDEPEKAADEGKKSDDGGLFELGDEEAEKPADDDDLFGGDDLFNDDGNAPPPVKDDPPKVEQKTITPLPIEQRVPSGGWYLDERDFALRYTPMGHGNAFLKQWLTSTANTENVANPQQVQGLFDTISSTFGAGCMKCHSVDSLDGSSKAKRVVNWHGKTPQPEERGFVKFSHRPHLNIAEMRNCDACHKVAAKDVLTSYQRLDPHNITADNVGFQLLTKKSCTTCHQPKLAGDNCTKCHNYHIGKPPRWEHKLDAPSDIAARLMQTKPANYSPSQPANQPSKPDDYSQGE